MDRRISFNTYRIIDLFFFALMVGVAEYILVMAASRWFRLELYTVSVTAGITAIVYMRWGPFGIIHAVLGGLVYVLANPAALSNEELFREIVIYCVGNVFSALVLILFVNPGRAKIRKGVLTAVGYGLLTQLLMEVGRGIVSMFFNFGPDAIRKFITYDALTFLFTALIVGIASRLDGIFEYQRDYLLRLQEERERQKEDGFKEGET